MGHTPQRAGINSAADGQIWRLDTGMTAMIGGRPEVSRRKDRIQSGKRASRKSTAGSAPVSELFLMRTFSERGYRGWRGLSVRMRLGGSRNTVTQG